MVASQAGVSRSFNGRKRLAVVAGHLGRVELVTASHVADLATQKGLQLGVADATHNARVLPLRGKVCGARGDFDVTVWELPDDLVERLPNRRFLSLADVDSEQRIRPGWFCLHGFPECWSTERDNKTATTGVPNFPGAF